MIGQQTKNLFGFAVSKTRKMEKLKKGKKNENKNRKKQMNMRINEKYFWFPVFKSKAKKRDENKLICHE